MPGQVWNGQDYTVYCVCVWKYVVVFLANPYPFRYHGSIVHLHLWFLLVNVETDLLLCTQSLHYHHFFIWYI